MDYYRVDRNEFSDITLSLVDAMCDIARITDNTQFEEIDLVDMCNHFVNFYFVNFTTMLDLDFIVSNTDRDIEPYKVLFKNPKMIKDNFALYSDFRASYVEAMLVELQASDVVQIGTNIDESGEKYQTYHLKKHMLERKTVISSINNRKDEINQFGLNLLAVRPYINEQLNVTEIRNDGFTVEYDKLSLDLSIGLLVYIAIGERYLTDKEKVIYTLLQYANDIFEKKEQEEKDAKDIEKMLKEVEELEVK